MSTAIKPGDVISVHIGGSGDAGTVTATAQVHVPTRRFISEWLSETEAVLGDPVSDLEERGYSVTPWGSP